MPTVTGTTTTVTGLTPGTQYRFRVRARNAVGYSDYGPWSVAGTPTGGGGGGGGGSFAGDTWTKIATPLLRTLDSVNGTITGVAAAAGLLPTYALYSKAVVSIDGVSWLDLDMPLVTLYGRTWQTAGVKYVPTSYAYGNGVCVATGCAFSRGTVVVSTLNSFETMSPDTAWSAVQVGNSNAEDTGESEVFFDGNRFLLRTGDKMWSSTTGFAWTHESTYSTLYAYATSYNSPSAAIWRLGAGTALRRSFRSTGPSHAMPSLEPVTATNPDGTWLPNGNSGPFGIPYDGRFYQTGDTWVWQRRKMYNYALGRHVAGAISELPVGVGSNVHAATSILPEPFVLANMDSYGIHGLRDYMRRTYTPRSVASRPVSSTLALAVQAPNAVGDDPPGRWLLRRKWGATTWEVLQTLPSSTWYHIACYGSTYIAIGNGGAYYSTGS